MKEQGIHEGCIEQFNVCTERLFSGKLLRMKREEFVMIGKCVPMFKKNS
jgi:trans-2-enoyl-CoA reductase